LDGDEPISEAFSVRENAAAAEVAVETAALFRRRGYGRQVTAAWAYHVMGLGKVAFYSYADENTVSQALARSLGVVQFSSVAAYE
jgi:predicted GNAT family acetyltransferase